MSDIFVPNRFYSPITEASLDNDELTLTFVSGGKLVLRDDYQQCCERRYMTTDDDLKSLIGASLVSIVVKDTGSIETKDDEYSADCHDVMFVDVVTSKGTVTLCTHNEHNGYYGGFDARLYITSSGGVTSQYRDMSGKWEREDE